MDISVITPIYGVERYIEKSLRSLFTQTKTDKVEFILVNDCTPDNSMAIARKVIAEFPHLNVKVVEHTKNGGLAVARQTGLDAASGEYMIHIDSDDWCEPTMLEDMFNCAKESGADVVVADIFINYPNKEVYKSINAPESGEECMAAVIEGRLGGSTSNKLTRRAICVDNNIRWVPSLDIAEDWLIYIKIFSYAKRVVSINKAYLHYFQNPNSLTNKKLVVKKLMNYIEADRLAYEYLTSVGLIDRYADIFSYGRVTLLNILMRNSRGKQQREFAAMYPDVKREHIVAGARVPKHYKLALLSARSGNLWFANIVYGVVDIFKNIIR